MEILTWLATNWTSIVVPAIVGLAGFFGGRRKKKLEVDSQETTNVGQNLQLYQTMLDDMDSRYKKMLEDRDIVIVQLTNKVDLLTDEIRKLRILVKSQEDGGANNQ